MSAIATDRIEFTGSQGAGLTARFDRAVTGSGTTAVFAHCFTCSKDIAAASRISRGLAARGKSHAGRVTRLCSGTAYSGHPGRV